MSDAERTAAIVGALREHVEAPLGCSCGGALCGHELVVSHAMGFKRAPRCLRCIAGAVGQEPDAFREHVLGYVQRQECWRTGWQLAGEQEGVDEALALRPPCLWPERAPQDAPAPDPTKGAALPAGLDRPPDATWDAGDMSCGDLLFALRLKMMPMAPGELIRVVARDVSAPIDMPAWCKLTRHALVAAEHPDYWIRRRDD